MYAVLKVIPLEGGDAAPEIRKAASRNNGEITVVGELAALQTGMTAEFTGHFEKHSEYGEQFRAKSYRESLPETADGLLRFLGSGVLPGVGPKLAEAMIRHFGNKITDVLNSNSKRLTEVPGIGGKKAQAIREAWSENAGRRECFIFLEGLGISPLLAGKLYAEYGDRAGELVRANPYRLADELRGIGFVKADAIARKLGVAADSPERLAAGSAYVMNELIGEGHTCYPRRDFEKRCSELLEQSLDVAKRGVERALSVKLLSAWEDFIYAPALLRAELELPRHLARLAADRNFAGQRLALAVAEGGKNQLSGEQLEAVNNICRYPLNIITGGPGVGKTTVVAEIVRRAKSAHLRPALAAPTGRAAKRLSEATGAEAKTLHRLLLFDPKSGDFYYNAGNPVPADLIIVDESSMLDLLLANSLFRAIRRGSSVVLLGDADQLPSVGAGTVLESFIASGIFKVNRLTRIFRQGRGSLIIENAHAVNRGVPPHGAPPGELSDFYWIKQTDGEKMLDIAKRLLTERIPERFRLDPVDDVQVLSPMNRGATGCVALNSSLQKLLNPGEKPEFRSGEKVFRTGDKVMQICNNYDKNVFNGDIGKIGVVMHHDRKFMVDFAGIGMVEYGFDEADELTLAYAVTVHKSQGCEFPAVILLLSSANYLMLRRNLLYTAMTRAKKLLVLIGGEAAVKMALDNAGKEKRYSNLTEFIRRELKKSPEGAII